MSGIELFLTKCLYDREEHPRRWDKYVYDDEFIHSALIQLLAENSPSFLQSLLGVSEISKNIAIHHEPEGGLFDLEFRVNGTFVYCEIKIWASLSESQFLRQTQFLSERDAQGIYVLFRKAADTWPSELVRQRSGGRCRVVGICGMLKALDSVDTGAVEDMRQVVDAYRKVLNHLNGR